MKKLLGIFALVFCVSWGAHAQGIGQLAPNQVWGNSTGSAAVASPTDPLTFKYTAPGTGGAAVTQQAHNQRILWANDYGAACDGSTNDATAFQNLINEAIALAVPARFIGICAISSALSITGSIDFGGSGTNRSILKVATGTNGIAINTTGQILLHDMQLQWPSGETSSTGITTTLGAGENAGSRYYNLMINGPFIGANIDRSLRYVFRDNWIANIPNSGFGLIINNATNCDDGDMHVVNNEIDTLGTGAAAVVYQGAGGLHFTGNKINGGTWGTGFHLALSSGCNTSDLFILGNSFEGLSTSGAGVSLQRSSSTGTFQNVMIADNEVAVNPITCIQIPTDGTGVWISNVTVRGNTCTTTNSASAVAYSFDSVNGLYLAGNAAISNNASTKLTNIGATGLSSTNCVIGPNIKSSGTFAASGVGSCTSSTPN